MKYAGRLGGAADAAHLHHALGLDAHLIEGFGDALRDGVVPATRAERGLAAAIVQDLESDAIGLDWLGCNWCGRHDYLQAPSCSAIAEVIGAGVDGQPVEVQDRTQLRHHGRIEIDLQKIEHLRVAVLLHHVNPVMAGHKVVHLLRKGIGANAQIVGRNLAFAREFVAALDHRPVAGAISDDADLLLACAFKDRLRNQRAARSRTCAPAAACCSRSPRDAPNTGPSRCGRSPG